jgi:FG-GAP-like repeat
MKRLVSLLFLMIAPLLFSQRAIAGQIKVYVSPFAVTGVQNKDELKGTLQSLLASRLSSDTIVTLDKPAGTNVTVTGSYVVFGKIFSVDAVAKDAAGVVITRAFIQGDNQDQLIPSMGKLAKELSAAIEKRIVPGTTAQAPAMQNMTATVPVPAIKKPENSNIIRNETAVPTSSDIVRASHANSGKPSELSQRLPGSLEGIAPGRTRPDGTREWYVVDDHALRLYLHDGEYKLLGEVSYRPNEYVLGVDTADLDGDGVPEAYVTVMKGEELSSEVWLFKDGALKRVANGLPYFFRGMALAGGSSKIYVQFLGLNSDSSGTGYGRNSSDFYGDVYELVKSGDKYERKNPLRLPDQAFIYNFTMFKGSDGQNYFIVLNDDGYLIVYSAAREELWRSSEKYGGSALSFKRENAMNVRATGTPYRSVFLQQRMFATRDGDIIVPQNMGTFSLGAARSYKKSAVYCFAWNGAMLDEKWHTKPEQNYIADFYSDDANKELVLLEVVKQEGVFAAGASIISIKKVE